MPARFPPSLWFPVALVFCLACVVVRPAYADGPKNLQVLPKASTKEQVKAVMKAQAKALGVECDFCHDVPDMASDKLDKKKTARAMMKMTDELNAKWFKPKTPVTCATCHRGKQKPEG